MSCYFHESRQVKACRSDTDSQSGNAGAENFNTPFYRKEPFIDSYIGAGATFGRGETFMDGFDADAFAELRKSHPFYPFSSQKEWELGCWLYNSGLSLASINSFFALELVRPSHLILLLCYF